MESKRTGKAEKEIMKMQIFVDADACPVVGIVEEIAKKMCIRDSIWILQGYRWFKKAFD